MKKDSSIHRKPSKVTPNTCISQDFPKLYIDNIQWQSLEKILSAPLNTTARAEIVEVANAFIEDIRHEVDSKNRMKLLQPKKDGITNFTRIQEKAKDFFDAWCMFSKDELARRMFEEAVISFDLPDDGKDTQQLSKRREIDIDAVALRLQEIDRVMEKYKAKQMIGVPVGGSVAGTGSISDPYYSYIRRLAKIATDAGIPIPKTKSTESSSSTQKFPQFLRIINSYLPEISRRGIQGEGALEQDIYRALAD